MKKNLVILLTIMMGLCTLNVSAQETVEIGTGTGTTYYGPFNSLWGYSFVEQIYTAEEIDMAGEITSISFYKDHGNGQTNNIVVYMKLVDRSSFSSNSDYEQVTAQDIVYQGSWEIPTTGWTTITLDTPFDYDGASNLMIAVHENTSGYTTQYFCYTAAANSMISFHSDSSDPDPYNLGAWSGTIYTQSNRPNIRMEIMPNGNNCYSPLAPAISDITAYEATLSWTPREGQSVWEVYCGTGEIDLDQVAWTTVTDTFYTFMNLTPATNYAAYVRTNCDGEVSNPRQVNFTTIATCPNVPTNVSVSNITASSVDVNWVAQADDFAWEVVVVPSGLTPESGIPVSADIHPFTVGNLNDATSYSAYVRTDCGGGDYSYWAGPVNFTTTPLCSSPVNVTVSQITGISALVSWNAAIFGATSYTVEYSVADEENWISEIVEGTQYMLSNLEPTTTYDVMVYSNCELSSADTVFKTFTTNCLAGGEIQIGSGTTTNYYIPVNNYYKYTYSQQIFLASEMNGAGEIHSVSFHYAYGSPMTKKTNVTIYLGHTTQSSFTSVSNYIPDTVLQQVYSGELNCTQGWNTFTFSTPFQYNGTDNLVLAVDDNTNDYDGSSYTFYVHSTGSDHRSLYFYSDSNNPDPSNPTAVTTNSSFNSGNRSNVKFGMECDDNVSCIAPNVYVSEVTPVSITIDWAPGYTETSWELEYGTNMEELISAGSVTAPYLLENLTPDTKYYVRVRSNCGSENSGWMTLSVRTDCSDITIPYMQDFDDAPASGAGNMVTCWTSGTNYTTAYPYTSSTQHHSGSYGVYFYGTSAYYSYIASPRIEENVAMDNLQIHFWAYKTSAAYYIQVGVMTDPNDYNTFVQIGQNISPSATSTWEMFEVNTDNYTGEGRYIAFRVPAVSTSYMYIDDIGFDYIPTCLTPKQLTFSNVTAEGATINWTPYGEESVWEVVAVPTGTAVAEGVPEQAFEYPYTLTGLMDNTTYDVYVRASCDGGDYSQWSIPVSFTTTPLCTSPVNVTVSQITGTSALISWESALYGATSYTVEYSVADEENWISEIVEGTQYMLSNLEPTTTYDVMVYSNCELSSADTVFKTFTTNCLAGGEIQIGSGTTTNYYIPVNNFYKYTYSQQIFLASEMNGAGEIHSVSFQYAYGTPMTDKTNVTIYLGHTTQSSFTSVSNYIPDTVLQQVYSGELNCTQGWNTFTFSTPFQYNGTDNLVLAVDDNTNDYDGNSYTFYVHSTGSDHRSLYFYSDSNNPDPSNPTAVTTTSSYNSGNRSNVKFGMECDDNVSCIAPNVYVSEVTPVSITIDWAPGYTETSWELEYGTSMEELISAGSVTAPYELENLTPDTKYYVRVRSNCGSENSGWTTLSVRTDCSDITIPYMQDFDDAPASGAGNMVSCWTPGTNYTTAYPYTSSTQHHSGSYGVYFYGTSAYYSYIASPRIEEDVAMDNLQVRFWAYKTSAAYNIQVGIMTDPNDYNTFVQIGENFSPSATSTWEAFEVNTDGYAGDGRYIAFRVPAVSTSYMYIDDIVIDFIPECMRPTDLTSTTATNNSITLSWTAGDENDSGWEIVYGAPGFDPDTVTPVFADTNPFEVQDLDPATKYQFYVRTVCGTSDYSIWSLPMSFATECDVLSVPYSEDFNSYITSASSTAAPTDYPNVEMPLCWNFLNNSTSSSNYPIAFLTSSSTYAASGNCLFFKSSSTTPIYAVLPEFDANLNTLQITFTYRNEGTTEYNGTLSLGYMTNNLDAATFVELANYPRITTLTEVTELLNGVPASDSTLYLAFKYTGGTNNNYYLSIDNITVEYMPACPSPVKHSVTASDIDGHNATISFVDNDPEHNSWTVYYRAANAPADEDWMTVITNETSVLLTGLAPETAYNVYVITNCDTPDDEPDATNTIQFTTLVSCPAPQNLTVTNIDLTSATITWSSNAESYTIEYGEAGFTAGTGTVVTTTETTYELTGLTPSTSYTVYVMADCGDEGTSTSSSVSFATACEAMNLPYAEDFENYTGSTYSDANGIAPTCWTTYSTNTTYGAPHITSEGTYHYVHSGTNCMVFTCGSAGSDAYAALPAFTENLNTLHLNFWRAMENTSNGTLTVGYVTNVNEMASTFVSVATIPSVGSSAGDTISVDFTGADIPENGNICFHWNYASSFYSCCIDDIAVTSSGSGPGPVITNPTVATNAASGATQTTATLNATITNPDNVTVTAKGFEWKTTMGGTYASIAGTGTGNTFTASLTNLTPNTSYTFKAFITYDGTTVYGDEMTFNTLPEEVQPCDVPTGLEASNITKESFTVTWNNNANVSSWNIQYRPLNGQLSSAVANTNHYDFTNLTSETVYQVQVQANCGDGNLSEWSDILTVTTLVDGIESYLFNSIALYPNPANEYVDVRIDGDVNVKSMEVFDVYGKLINTVNVIDNPTRINVSGLADGMYFVRVTTEQGVATKTFVKK